jgi:hypothetical protein
MWWLTSVYGPQQDAKKVLFLDALRSLCPTRDEPWLLRGDFNLIYKASDKSNSRVNRRLMEKFHQFLKDMELSELDLHGHLYTWSNKQDHPTLSKIDRAFACLAWCDTYPHHHLRAGSSSGSNHTPLLHKNANGTTKKRFYFESIWPRFPRYLDVVAAAWQCPVQNADAFRVLDCKLRCTARAL